MKRETWFKVTLAGTAALAAAALVLALRPRPPQKLGGHLVAGLQTGPYYIGDPVLGYRFQPGLHRFDYDIGGERGAKWVVIDADGTKATSLVARTDDRRPELWLMGCSFVAGDGLSNDETFAWIVQQNRPALKVRNYGCSSYGSLQALLRLRDAVAHQRRLPRWLVFFYGSWQPERNVGSSDWLARFNPPGRFDESGRRHIAAAGLSNGALTVQLIPYADDRAAWHDALAAAPTPHAEAVEVEKAIFDELHALCTAHRIELSVAIVSQQIDPRTMDSPTIRHVRGLGIPVADLSLPAGNPEDDARYQQIPGKDVHPTAAGHRRYAAQLLERF